MKITEEEIAKKKRGHSAIFLSQFYLFQISFVPPRTIKTTCHTVQDNCKLIQAEVQRHFGLFRSILTLTVKPWLIQSFINLDSMDRRLKCDHSLESC